VVSAALAALVLAGCGSSSGTTAGNLVPAGAAASVKPAEPVVHEHGVKTSDAPEGSLQPPSTLQPGQRWIDIGLPGGTYTPQAPNGGTDDYRCVLLDPGLTTDTFLAGVDLAPGNPGLVHHAILYRVEPGDVAEAQALDAADPSMGWSCFGGPGLRGQTGDPLAALDTAPWVAAFATRGGEQLFPKGTGELLTAGSRLILQLHYNLLNGGGTDSTHVFLRVASPAAHLAELHTYLMPAPVELPCLPGQTGPLCNRANAVLDVMHRFGVQEGATINGLQLLCGGNPQAPKAGPTQTCTRTVTSPMVIRSAAGHMHMLGRKLSITLQRAAGGTTTVLNIANWDFDNQSATVLAHPLTVRPGDRLTISCTHDASLRSKIPSLQKLPNRYVVWGEGSSDEMCLGIIGFTS
jgi:Copper type II ascorbate-dependent monooxygenase, C-terminal domain